MNQEDLPSLFADGVQVIKAIEEAGHQAYFVGGCVRDLILKRNIKDIDIATAAAPEQITKIFKKVIPVGIEHGTVIVRYHGKSFEVTTFRIDGDYTDQRHPDEVEFVDKIDEDLKRRDFTINALAMDKDGNIIDLFQGQEDLNRQLIRTVGIGYDRFMEDPLRMIRAIRFASQLGFHIESETLKQLKSLKHEVDTLAVERLMNECEKLFSGDYVEQGINYLKTSGIYRYLPVFKEHLSLINNIPKSLIPLASFAEVIALFHHLDASVSIEKWVKAWKCSNKIKNESMKLVEAICYYKTYGFDKWLVYRLPKSYYKSFLRVLQSLDPKHKITEDLLLKTNQELIIQSRKDLVIDGNDIARLFPDAKKGPWIRQILETLEKKVVFEELMNEKNDLKEWILCNPPEIN